MKNYEANTLEDTKQVAKAIAKDIGPGSFFALDGDLGAGKTTLVQLICNELEVSEYVNSPTFTIVNEYETGRIKINHIDFYRVRHVDELMEIGMDQYFNETEVTFIEWASLFEEILPEGIIKIGIERTDEGRRISVG